MTEVILSTPFLIGVPIVCYRIIKFNRKNLQTEQFLEKYKFLIDGINVRNTRYAKYFYSMFLSRTFLLLLIPLISTDSVQIIL